MKPENHTTNIIFPDITLPYVKMQCNNDFFIYENPPYIAVAEEFLHSLNPQHCLELGAGLGRMSVYFRKHFNWQNTCFYLQDGDSGDQSYGGIRHSQENEYYNAFAATEAFCNANSLTNFKIINDIKNITDKIDFLYSFASIGFHWHINLYLDTVLPKLNPNARLMFELRAPKSEAEEADESIRQKYQDFYDSQLAYAQAHPNYEIIDVLDLQNYKDYVYKDKSHYLILAPKI